MNFKDGDYLGNDPILSAAYGFGCVGGNLSPQLSWSDAPAGAQSFAVPCSASLYFHADDVFDVVVQGIAGVDALQGQAPDAGDQAPDVVGLVLTVSAPGRLAADGPRRRLSTVLSHAVGASFRV